MAKKRQADFGRTKLRAGRSIAKRNITKTSFKAKKITVSTKKAGSKFLTIMDCLEGLKGDNFPASKLSTLKNLNQMVINQQESVLTHLAEVLEVISKLLLDSEPSIRHVASDVLCNIFSKCSNSEAFKMKLSSFHPLLTNTLSCGMSHTSMSVKQNMLGLLMCILLYYPDFICNTFAILKNLLSMITGPPRKTSLQSAKSKTSLPTIYDDNLISGNWRISVLKNMKLFLKVMLEKNETRNDIHEEKDEQEVYWNCESPLHVEIFAGSGLKPINIEKPVNNFNFDQINFDDPSVIDDFILPMVTLIPEIFTEEISERRKRTDNYFPVSTIKNLNVLFEVLYHLTEWIKLISCDEVENIISNFLLNSVYGCNLFPFYSSGVFQKNQCPEVAELNLTVCYLHGKYLLQSKCDKNIYDITIAYIKSVFQMHYEIKINSIPMLVKIMKIYHSSSEINQISEFIIYTVSNLSTLLENTTDCQSKAVLVSLFSKLSLHPAYNFLTNTDAMVNWFNWLLNQVIDIPNSGEVNKNILQITNLIANRKYPIFLEALEKIEDNSYKALLQYDNPHVRDTAIFLLYNMPEIKDSLFYDISKIILLDSSFPLQYAIRFIRLLTSKFVAKPGPTDCYVDLSTFRRGQQSFIIFLINVAIDSPSLWDEKWYNYYANEYTKAMEPFKDIVPYNVLPSLHWKKHLKIFEVCQKSLSLLPQKYVNHLLVRSIQETLESRNLPMHCALAILKLNVWDVKERIFRYQVNNLVFSCLFTTSVLTYMTTEEEWYLYNVTEVMDSIEMNRRMAVETLENQVDNIDEIAGIAVYHILRICKFYLERRLFKAGDGERVTNVLEGLTDKCTEKTLKQQPLFQQLYNIFKYA